MSVCRSTACRAEIVFAIGPNGRAMPFDAEPAEGGQWELSPLVTDGKPELRARHVGQPEALRRTDLHLPHFATCPDRKRFRKRARAAE